MSFRVERVYTAIPCVITYTVYDVSGTSIFTETVTNPPGPNPTPPAPPCFIGTPSYLIIIVNPGPTFNVPVDCNNITQQLIPCPTSHIHSFSACLMTDPTSTCSNVLQINL